MSEYVRGLLIGCMMGILVMCLIGFFCTPQLVSVRDSVKLRETQGKPTEAAPNGHETVLGLVAVLNAKHEECVALKKQAGEMLSFINYLKQVVMDLQRQLNDARSKDATSTDDSSGALSIRNITATPVTTIRIPTNLELAQAIIAVDKRLKRLERSYRP